MEEKQQIDYLKLCVEHGLYLMVDKESQSVIILFENGKKEDGSPIICRVSEPFGEDVYETTKTLIRRVFPNLMEMMMVINICNWLIGKGFDRTAFILFLSVISLSLLIALENKNKECHFHSKTVLTNSFIVLRRCPICHHKTLMTNPKEISLII